MRGGCSHPAEFGRNREMGKDLNGKELGKGISQRKDGLYVGRASCNGQSIVLYGKNFQKLKKELEDKKKLAMQNLPATDVQYTVSEWFDMWFATYKLPVIREQSEQPMKSKVKYTFLDRIGNMRLIDVKSIDVQNIVNDLLDEGKYAYSSVSEAFGRLRECFESAVYNHLIATNPCMGVVMKRNENKASKEIRFMDKAQIKEFLDEIKDDWWYECFYIMIYTGLRIGEVGGLRWEDVDFENRCIRVKQALISVRKKGERNTKFGPLKTANSYRTIPFIGDVEKMLRRQKKKDEQLRKILGGKYPGDDNVQNLVFYTQKGTPTSRYAAEHALNRIVKRMDVLRAYKAKADGEAFVPFIKLHPHALRHTFCSLLYFSKVDPKACQQLMGHANISTTLNIYTHLGGEAVSEELRKVEDLIEAEKVV